MKFTVRMRMFLAFTFLVMALIGIGIYAIYSVNVVNNQSTIITKEWLPGLNYANQINTKTSDFRICEYRHIIATDAAEMEEMEERMNTLQIEIDKNMEIYQGLINNDNSEIFNKLQNECTQYLAANKKVIAISRQFKTDEAMQLMRNESKAAFDKVSQTLSELVEYNQENADMADKTGDALYSSTVKTLIFVIIFIALLAISFAVVITNSIIKPIYRLAVSADKLAQGNLDVEIDDSARDEIGQLANSFKRMADNSNDILTNINSSSEQVAAGAKQVSVSSMSLSQGATEQASSIEQATASIEQISVQTKLNAENANKANILAEEAKENAVAGNEQMKEMLQSMDEINVASGNISKIIKVIDEIAFQTNILALNAAVEAARAGQHGKGFAVVAEEVRNLAARSANAAKETTEMIEGSIRKVEEGTKIANETAEELNKIVEEVAKAASLVNDIAVASNEQAAGIAQVTQGIAQISQVVQSNSATSQESAAASEELSTLAELLKQQVARFKLKKNNSPINVSNGLNSEVLKMLENMTQKKNMHNVSTAEEDHEEASVKISLSDKEFGKY